ncbi:MULTISPECIES: hypothetical protein [Winogradskyella]|uniref:Sensor domain-containing protein n=2 Tax=Winogradskyella TaxID=286104 RepID=A0ABT7ZUR6_9FLAO|nr:MULTISPECIES: hypothetical protein [Winogradskyella]MBC3844930.1 hypothetical protein [Winogradskyella echinorum]MBC5749278.1 hypothetical protein [Winogradskyella echinorum]MDN3492750.1 hypothetical protein [Winogradskyella bathintestinalis]
MEKSIENIWKEGFLKSDALVVPKINNLYNQKSIHIIDKFKRMFKINLIAIVAFSFAFLVVSFIIGIPITGIIFFVTLSVLVVINKRLLNDLEKIDIGISSYQYLKAFNQWINKQVSINKRFSRFLYPIIFMSLVLGFWFKDAEGMPLGERLVNEILVGFPDTYLIFGIPLIGIVIVAVILVLLFLVGGRIYKWDLNIVYGRLFKKLEELMTDIESLRS